MEWKTFNEIARKSEVVLGKPSFLHHHRQSQDFGKYKVRTALNILSLFAIFHNREKTGISFENYQTFKSFNISNNKQLKYWSLMLLSIKRSGRMWHCKCFFSPSFKPVAITPLVSVSRPKMLKGFRLRKLWYSQVNCSGNYDMAWFNNVRQTELFSFNPYNNNKAAIFAH